MFLFSHACQGRIVTVEEQEKLQAKHQQGGCGCVGVCVCVCMRGWVGRCGWVWVGVGGCRWVWVGVGGCECGCGCVCVWCVTTRVVLKP